MTGTVITAQNSSPRLLFHPDQRNQLSALSARSINFRALCHDSPVTPITITRKPFTTIIPPTDRVQAGKRAVLMPSSRRVCAGVIPYNVLAPESTKRNLAMRSIRRCSKPQTLMISEYSPATARRRVPLGHGRDPAHRREKDITPSPCNRYNVNG